MNLGDTIQPTPGTELDRNTTDDSPKAPLRVWARKTPQVSRLCSKWRYEGWKKSPGMPYHGLILLHVCRGNSHGCVCRRAQGHTEGQGGSGGNPRGALTLKLPRVSRAKGNKTQVLGKKHHHKLLCWNVSKIPQNGVQRMSIHNNNSLITSENKSYTCFGQNKL